MGVLATITISAVNYTVYAITSNAVTDASNYFAGLLRGAAFTNATTLQKQQALIEAARWIDRESWEGTLTVSSQTTAFPRNGLDDDEGNVLADNSIPDDVAYGEFELALALLTDLSVLTSSSTGTGGGVRQLTTGPVSVTFWSPFSSSSLGISSRFPSIAMQLLAQFLAAQGASAAPISSGTGDTSTWDPDSEEFLLTQGYP